MFSIFIMPKLMLVFTLFYGWYLNTSHDICIPDEYHEGHKVYISIDLEFVIIQMTFKVSKTRSEILCRERCSHCSIEDIFRSGPEWRSSWRKCAASDSTRSVGSPIPLCVLGSISFLCIYFHLLKY